VLDEGIAFLVTDALREALERGTGTAVRQSGFRGPAAGKTGTTNDGTDTWFVGYTPEVVGAVWIGFDRQQVLVCGSGLVLETPDGEIDVRQPFRPVRFAGETRIVSRLEAGPVEVVNLMGDRLRVVTDLSCLTADATTSRAAGIHVIYAATTPCDLAINGNACEVAAGHAVRIEAGESFTIASRLGTAIVASIVPVVPASVTAAGFGA